MANTQREKGKRSVFQDQLSAFLLFLIGLVIIGALLTLVFAILSGVMPIREIPQTADDYAVILARGDLEKADDAERAQAWATYIMALADNNRTSEARRQLAEAKAADLDVERTQAILYAEAHLLETEGKLDEAADIYKELSKKLMDAYEAEKTRGGDKNWAVAFGVPENYTRAQLRLAVIATENEEWEKAIDYLDGYLEMNPQAAGVLIDRGNAKLGAGDKAGALEDFEAALKFLPGDPEALAGKRKAEE